MHEIEAQQFSAQIEAAGKRLTPVYPGGKTQPYANGQSYSYRLQPDLYRDASCIGVVLDDLILVDYDGNKPGANAVPLAEVEKHFGPLWHALFQLNDSGTSLHFLFRRPADVAASELRQSCDGLYLSGVDIKTGNQLVHVKPVGSDGKRKVQYFATLQTAPIAPAALIEVLRRKAKPTETVPFKEFSGNAHPEALAAFNRDVCAFEGMAAGQDGGRNNKLNALTLQWLSTAYSGDLDPEFVESKLRNAAAINGCEGVDATIASAKKKAKTQPCRYRLDTTAAFGPGVTPVRFEELLGRIRAEGCDAAKVPELIDVIRAAGCDGLQVESLAAELKKELHDAGLLRKGLAVEIDKRLTNSARTQQQPSNIDPSTGIKQRTGSPVMTAAQQLAHFNGCTYVRDLHRVFTPDGSLLKSEQFDATYAGYAFVITNDGKTTKRPFEAFTGSQLLAFPQAHSTCFKPWLPTGASVDDGERRLVNTYRPAGGIQIPGDVSPFLDHVARLLPNPADQEILLSFLAACAQFIGCKFQWCVVLQGVEGNGKSVLARALTYALGERYVHLPNAADLGNRFNGWIEGKVLIVIEELQTGGRQEIADTLKPMITNARIEVQAKNCDQRTTDNVANFLIFSNHKDAVLKTENDRRYAVFYSAQQEIAHLARNGMTGDYFARLYGWLERGGGYANVAHYLATRPVTVDVMGRAPATSSTSEAVRSSQGVAEQFIQEAVDLAEKGFRSDFICTQEAATFLKNRGKQLSPQRLSEVLANVGYIRHPALENSAGKVSVGGRRRRLYVKRGSLVASLPTPQAVAEAWCRTNEENAFSGPSCPATVQPFGPPTSQ